MTDNAEASTSNPNQAHGDIAPGDDHAQPLAGVLGYAVGLALAIGLTLTSFWAVHTHLLWAPGVPVGLLVLAVAQMGVHLVFFLHVTTGSDSTNNVMALAFGILIVTLVVGGSLWIMSNLNHNTMLTPQMMNLHLQK